MNTYNHKSNYTWVYLQIYEKLYLGILAIIRVDICSYTIIGIV